MTPFASDRSLLDGLSAGRSDAFERLYADHHAAIYNLCARVLCDREEAKDLTQDVFITAFNHFQAPEAEPVRKLRPWLYRVATNACFDHLRSRKHLDGGGDAQLENAASGVDEFERSQTVALVEQSLAGLNERYRTALVLKDLQGLPPEEIAEVMEISRPTADVLVHRARASFKTAFAKLAGDKAVAPAALGLVLLPLSVPAALQAMPPWSHAAPAAHVPSAAPPVHHGAHVPDLSSAAGPGGAGLLAKIGAALSTKVGITAVAATLAIGGGTAAYENHATNMRQAETARMWQSWSGRSWQAASAKWSKQWARWSLYSNWMRNGWPMGWNSGMWRWSSRSGSWSWMMKGGSTWSSGSGQMASSGSWGGSSWTMSTSRSGSSGWSSGSGRSGSGSSSKKSMSSGSWSGSGSTSSGSWSGGGSGSGGSWGGGSSGGSGSMGGSGW